ncbi:transcriptional repressor [Rhizophlyctis rosea]|nr:transcriptional repressor [Rhizophlyctis rosea]
MPVAAAADPDSLRFPAEHPEPHVPPAKTRRGLDKNWHPKYVCHSPGCNKTFTTSAHLSRHVKLHMGIKPHRCPIPDCGKGFARRDNMMVHYRAHTRKLGLTAANKEPAPTRYRNPATTAVRGRQPSYHPPPEHAYGNYYPQEPYGYYPYEGPGNYTFSPRPARNMVGYPGAHQLYEMHGPSAYTPRGSLSYAQRMQMMEQWHQLGGSQAGSPPAGMIPDQPHPNPHPHLAHGPLPSTPHSNQASQGIKMEQQQQQQQQQPDLEGSLENYALPIATEAGSAPPFSYHSLIASPHAQAHSSGQQRWGPSSATGMEGYQQGEGEGVGVAVESDVPFVAHPTAAESGDAPTEEPSVETVGDVEASALPPAPMEGDMVDGTVAGAGDEAVERSLSESVTPPSPTSQLQQAYTNYPSESIDVQNEGDGEVGALDGGNDLVQF